MKKIIFACFVLIFATSCFSADVNFAWDYTPNPEIPPAGFELRLSNTAGGVAAMTQDCPSPTIYECKVMSVGRGDWFATVRAYTSDVTGKQYSDPSNEVNFKVSGIPANPTNIRIKK